MIEIPETMQLEQRIPGTVLGLYGVSVETVTPSPIPESNPFVTHLFDKRHKDYFIQNYDDLRIAAIQTSKIDWGSHQGSTFIVDMLRTDPSNPSTLDKIAETATFKDALHEELASTRAQRYMKEIADYLDFSKYPKDHHMDGLEVRPDGSMFRLAGQQNEAAWLPFFYDKLPQAELPMYRAALKAALAAVERMPEYGSGRNLKQNLSTVLAINTSLLNVAEQRNSAGGKG